jgi:hypothetical protein
MSAMDAQPAVLYQVFGVAPRHPRSRTEAEQRWGQIRHQGFHRARVALLVANHQIAKLVFVLAGAPHGIARTCLKADIAD